MSRRKAILPAGMLAATVFLLSDAAVPASAQARPRQRAHPSSTQLIIEGGLAQPLGDLGDDYVGTVKGFGAETGYDVGVRFRATWPSGWTVSPSFHYEDFGSFTGWDGELAYEISTSILRYGVDVQYFWPAASRGPRPFLSAGLALCRNRYRDEILGESFYETAVNGLGVGLGAGVKAGDFELTLTYHLNRFESARLVVPFVPTDYSWDYVTLRAGFALPSGL